MNNITVCGNITRDPELRYTTTGKPVTSFGVADNRTKDRTIFFDCSAFDDIAERIVKYFKKGRPIFVSGTLDQRPYTGKDGVERTSLSVTIHSWDFVNVGGQGPGAAGGGQQPQQGGYNNNSGVNPYEAGNNRPAPTPPPAPPMPDVDIPDIQDPFADQ